ncbi:tRNA pseudouridine(55) synthase TruB [Candidatus Dojkabacteria bacterium]|jgi:tRNA pseudouridine55 synthase|nr:tRNA pseudouridine(55) synthase TruB [Candidatus Dojkabacteria bacterium]
MENEVLNEILLVDKPEGMTSYDVIRKIKSRYPKKTKIGHCGTLDSFATGLLILLIGKATKRQDEFHKLNKVYQTTAVFGFETDTQDITGKEINRDGDLRSISKEEIEKKINEKFIGKIFQIPPSYSAKKIDGVRAYKLAREGKEVELNPNSIEIFSFKILSYNFPEVTFEVECAGGTYIRSLINDLGKGLGTFATCKTLRRISIGEYNVKDAIKLE